jgi:aquaporin Z
MPAADTLHDHDPALTANPVYAEVSRRAAPAPAGPSMLAKCLTEFLGTFFLVLTIGLVIKGNKTDEPFALAPLAIGAVLMAMVYMGGHVSGAHYNPAVSIAILMRGKMRGGEFLPYIIAQLAGAVCAALAVYAILGKTFAPTPDPGATAFTALFVEFLFTFALTMVVLNVATTDATANNSFFGLAIGFTVMVGAIAGGGVSGGAYNPAVGVGPAIIDAMMGGGSMKHVWIYSVGPFAGAATAAGAYMIQNAARRA